MRGLKEGETLEQWVVDVWSAKSCDRCQCDIDDVRSVWVWDDCAEKTYELFDCPDLYPHCGESEFNQIKRVAEDYARIGFCFCSKSCAEESLDLIMDHCNWCHKMMHYEKEPYMVSDDMLKIMPLTNEDFQKVENTLTFCCLLCAEDYVSHR
jgi:hypothetical protein